MSFKAYSERRKVRTSLLNVYKIAESEVDTYLVKDAESGKWGFHYEMNLDGALVPRVLETAQDEISKEVAQDEILALTNAIVEAGMPEVYIQAHNCSVWPFPSQTDVVEAPPEVVLETEVENEVGGPSPDAFSSFAFAQLTANHNLPVATSDQKKKKSAHDDEIGGKIEKDRPEQNGVKRPSAGGKCREVWDTLDGMLEEMKRTPTSKEIKGVANAKGWELVTTCIQYYQWRKFNGIKGRI